MSQKLFVLGLPGSGKSTVSRFIVKNVMRHYDDFSATRLSDYNILYEMFEEDKVQQQFFYPTAHNGFYVKKIETYDAALMKLEQKVANHKIAKNEFIIIEFARNDYLRAFRNFSKAFLQDAYFLFLDVDIEIGMKRVRDRVKHPDPTTRDDHFVSSYTFEAYRQRDNAKYLCSIAKHLTLKYGINPRHIKIVDNRGPQRNFWNVVFELINTIVNEAPILI
jgi:adenylate kinase family enzyme